MRIDMMESWPVEAALPLNQGPKSHEKGELPLDLRDLPTDC